MELLEARLLLDAHGFGPGGWLGDGPVPPPNDPPVAVDDAASTTENRGVAVNVLANDSDPDGDRIWVAGHTPAADGRATYIGFGRFWYQPDRGFVGEDTFDYTIRDKHGGTATATVDIAVAAAPANQPPVAVADTATTVEGKRVIIHVLANDSDPDGDCFWIVGNTPAANGTAVPVGWGRIAYRPDPGFTGTDTFDYTIRDRHGGEGTATVTVTIEELPANNPPDAVDDSATTTQGMPVVVDALSNDTDLDGDRLRVVAFTQPDNGTVFHLGRGRFVYRSQGDFLDTDTFTYTIGDGHGERDTATVSILVEAAPENNPPEANDDAATAIQGTWTPIDALANDGDPDGDPLRVVGLTQPDNGVVFYAGHGKFAYRSRGDYTGPDTFQYTIGDGRGGRDTATVTVTVDPAPVNEAPDAVDDAVTTTQGVWVKVDVLANDIDPEGDRLRVIGLTQPDNGTVVRLWHGSLWYIPRRDFTGTETFSYTIGDGHGGHDTATVTVTVDPAPEPPAEPGAQIVV